MGRNNRRRNKWKGDRATETGLPHRRRWGSGYGRGASEDGVGDPELDISPVVGRSKGIKGSGKLRARRNNSSDSSIGGTPSSNGSKLTDEGEQTTEPLRTEGGGEHQANDEKHDVESATRQESRTKTNHKSQQQSSTTSHAAAGLEQGSSTGDVLARAVTTVDEQHPRQLQLKSPEEEVCQGRTTEVEDEGAGASNNEDIPAVVNSDDTLVDSRTPHLATAAAPKECDGTGAGSLSDETTTIPSDVSPCNVAATRTTSAGSGVVVPVLRLGNEHREGGAHEQGMHHRAGTAKVVTGDTPYSLAWADGRTGRQLMASVEGLLEEWLCAQEAEVRLEKNYVAHVEEVRAPRDEGGTSIACHTMRPTPKSVSLLAQLGLHMVCV